MVSWRLPKKGKGRGFGLVVEPEGWIRKTRKGFAGTTEKGEGRRLRPDPGTGDRGWKPARAFHGAIEVEGWSFGSVPDAERQGPEDRKGFTEPPKAKGEGFGRTPEPTG
jgi:hypothetical protein